MHLAQELLTTNDLSIMAVIHRTGYNSEEAFSRVHLSDPTESLHLTGNQIVLTSPQRSKPARIKLN